MIRPYSGEYLVSPIPLHLMGARCSHNCWYCFASNPPRPETTITQFLAQAKKLSNPSLTAVDAFLWRNNHEILFSNTTDPLCVSNLEFFDAAEKYCRANGRGMAIQTKGGKGIDILRRAKPSFVYVTLTSDNADFLKENEPGAPEPGERVELMQEMKKLGHFVVWGLNPYFPEWWASLKGTAEKLLSSGVNHVWLGAPHLSSQQLERLPGNIREKHSRDIEIMGAREKKTASRSVASATSFLHDIGFNCFSGAVSSRGNFWKPYFDLGKKFAPTLDGFVSHIQSKNDGPVSFSFDFFHKWANIFGDLNNSGFKQYFSNIGRSLRNAGKSDKAYSSSDVHRVFWDIVGVLSPFRQDYFGYCGAMVGSDAKMEKIGGEEVMCFVPGGFDDILLPISETTFLG